MITHYHLNKYFNLIQEKSLLKIFITFLKARFMPKMGPPNEGITSEEGPAWPASAYRQALTLSPGMG
jgi:hypothetical protein